MSELAAEMEKRKRAAQAQQKELEKIEECCNFPEKFSRKLKNFIIFQKEL